MKNRLFTVLDNFREMDNERSNELISELLALEHEFVQSFEQKNIELIKKVKLVLEAELGGRKPKSEEWQSYFLGRMHTLIEIMTMLLEPHELMVQAQNLTASNNDRALLNIIAQSQEISQSKITQVMSITNWDVNNALKTMLEKGFVNTIVVGRNRWYSITQLGERILERSNKLSKEKEFQKFLNTLVQHIAKPERSSNDYSVSNYVIQNDLEPSFVYEGKTKRERSFLEQINRGGVLVDAESKYRDPRAFVMHKRVV